MATLLTTSWKIIGSKTIGNTGYSDIVLRIYAKYSSQSTTANTTSVQRKLVLYLKTGSFTSSGCSWSLTGCGSKSGQNLSVSAGEKELLASKSANVTNNTDGTSKTTTLTCSYDIYGKSGSFTAQFTVPKINRVITVTSATDFTDETNPTLSFSNPGGLNARPYLNFYDSAGNKVYAIARTTNVSSPYVWSLSDEEREAMRQATNKQSSYRVQVGIETYSGSTYVSYSSVAKTMNYVNANPTYTSEFIETNQKVINLLGPNSNSIVKNASNIKGTINPTTMKYATISSIRIAHGGTTINLTTSPYEYTFVAQSNIFEILVTDSRGFTASGTIERNLIDYLPMKIMQYSFNRVSPVDSTVILNAQIQYKQADFNGTINVPVIQWKRGQNGQLNTISDTSYSISDNTITINNLHLEDVIDYREQDTFYLLVNDLLTEDAQSSLILKGVPTYEAGEHDLQVNGDLFIADINRENKINVKEEIINSKSEIQSLKKEQKVLWEGATYMSANQRANLSEKISEQKTGIVLVWSAYTSSQAQNYDWTTYFIPKHFLNLHAGQGFDIHLHTPTFGHIGGKYVYINDESIVGHANNTATGSNNGVTYANNYWVLRYVIGV